METKWRGHEMKSLSDTKAFWEEADDKDLLYTMGSSRRRQKKWNSVVANIITRAGSVYDPGCGDGILSEELPEGCSYYGVDLNAKFIERGQSNGLDVEVADIFDIEVEADWVLLANLMALFPEEDTWRVIRHLWDGAGMGMAISTLNYHNYFNPRARKNKMTSHKPEELVEFLKSLPGAGEVYTRTDLPDGVANNRFCTYVYREDYDGEHAKIDYAEKYDGLYF